MAKIPETSAGLSETSAVAIGKGLRRGWDILRSLQFNKKASVLRYTVSAEGRPDLGIDDSQTLVPGLADLDVYVSRVSTREVYASRGVIELTDTMFIFYTEVKDTDKILYDGKTYNVVKVLFWDPDIGRSGVVGRAA